LIEGFLKDVKEILKQGRDLSVRVPESHKRIYQAISEGETAAAAAEMGQHVSEVGDDLIAIRKTAVRPSLESRATKPWNRSKTQYSERKGMFFSGD